jgi:hypothetical protein
VYYDLHHKCAFHLLLVFKIFDVTSNIFRIKLKVAARNFIPNVKNKPKDNDNTIEQIPIICGFGSAFILSQCIVIVK